MPECLLVWTVGMLPDCLLVLSAGNGAEVQAALESRTGQSTVPNTFINGVHVGGASDTLEKHKQGALLPLLNVTKHDYEYDMVRIDFSLFPWHEYDLI